MKPVAIVNDSTGETVYVLQGYDRMFTAKYEVIEINEYGRNLTNMNDYSAIEVKHGGFAHVLSSGKYSVIYEEEDNDKESL